MNIEVNKIITLGNKEKYLVISHVENNLKDYYYIAELDENEKALHLLSLNKAYAPIQVKENQTFKVFGKVVE